MSSEVKSATDTWLVFESETEAQSCPCRALRVSQRVLWTIHATCGGGDTPCRVSCREPALLKGSLKT